MITRSFSNNFEVEDWTLELKMVPNIRTPLSDYGIFKEESISQTVASFEQTLGTVGLISDSFRGAQVYANKDESRIIHSYVVPYFKQVDYLTAEDIQGVRAYGSADQAETLAAAMDRKLRRMKNSALMTREYARFYAITQGKIWSPSGAVPHDSFYTDFNVTRKEVDFALSTSTTDIMSKIDEIIKHIQDNAFSNDPFSGVVAFCSTEFFSALISHPKVVSAYQYYSSSQEPNRNRVGGATALYREFIYGGCIFREINDNVNGSRFLPQNEAYFLPMGSSDTFVTYVAPGNKIQMANTLGEEMYLWKYSDPEGEKDKLELEFSHIHLIRRPQTVVKAIKN